MRQLARPPLLGRATVATLLTTLVLFAYWELFTWVPAYLASPVESGGAGLSVVRSSTFIIPMQLGAWAGYVLFGVIADRWNWRPTFTAFVLAAAAVVPLYGQARPPPGAAPGAGTARGAP